MRSTCSLYVDVGYLLASAASLTTGTSLRSSVHVEFGPLIASLVEEAEQRCGLPLLRVHWYDSAHNGVPDAQQQRIGELSRVKLRLGRFGVDGQQKGVDLRIGLDLVSHARKNASEIFFLVSGDDDLTEAVEEAQAQGVQVVVLAVPNASAKPHGVSRYLVRAADELATLDAATLRASVLQRETPARPVETSPAAAGATTPADGAPSPLDLAARRMAPAARPVSAPPAAQPVLRPVVEPVYQATTGGTPRIAAGYDDLEDVTDSMITDVASKVCAAFRASATSEDLVELRRRKPSIPKEIDRALLQDLSEAVGAYDLDDATRFRLRASFWDQAAT